MKYKNMKYNISKYKTKIKHRKTKSIKDMCILDHIEKIIEISKEYGVDKCHLEGKIHFDYVCEKLRISPLQAVIFSHFMEKCDDYHISISEIAKSLKCSMVRIMKYMNECEALEKMKLIRCNRSSDSISYRIPRDVCEALSKNNEFKPVKKTDLSIYKLFSFLNRIFEERNNNELTYSTMKLEILELINQNMHLTFCQKILNYDFGDDDTVLLLCFCHLSRNNSDDDIKFYDLDFIYDSILERSDLEHELCNGEHVLMEKKLVEYADSNGFAHKDRWKLSEYAKKELLEDFNRNSNTKDLIHYKKIHAKKMYYNTRETTEIQKLTSLLHEENFKNVQQRLDKRGMRKGFACLFSGAPGTGKTETVYQIARETKRDIMMVDISDTKSMWYGESEKRIKEIFDNYRNLVEKSDGTPILLINEADAIIGKRQEIGSVNRSINKTENTIQNIILQEIENLSGILIATTNLTQNMDKAFERRFLYKITFDKPTGESRKEIWKAMLPDLTESSAEKLANTFEISGGQIENIARKTEVDAIINGKELSLDSLTQYCKDEIQNGFVNAKKIGFGV